MEQSIEHSLESKYCCELPLVITNPRSLQCKRLKGEESLGSVKQEDATNHSALQNITNSERSNSSTAAATLTPSKKKREPTSDPGTPSANFKMLSAVAASLEYAGNGYTNCSHIVRVKAEEDCIDRSSPTSDKQAKISRKERSLAFICDKFLASYPAHLSDQLDMLISLDEVAVQLDVERRRVYDIVNVLESIGMVKRIGKNKYMYFGKKYVPEALRKLAGIAKQEKLKEKLYRAIEMKENCFSESKSFDDMETESTFNAPSYESKKQNSLGAISERFLMLFLVTAEKLSINLDTAAQVLMENSRTVERNAVHFKTKVRRLYDIANIFISVGLIERDISSGKQSFKYKGPAFNELSESNSGNCPASSSSTPVMSAVLHTEGSKAGSRKQLSRVRSENFDLPEKRRKIVPKHSFTRHSSLQDICAVAEIERKRLFASESSCAKESPSTKSDGGEKSVPEANTKVFCYDKCSENQLPKQYLRQKTSKPQIVTIKEIVIKPSVSSSCNNQNAAPSSCPCSPFVPVEINQKQFEILHASERAEHSGQESEPLAKPLTGDQKEAILKSLNITLGDGQIAAIFIHGSSNGTESSSAEKNTNENGVCVIASANSMKSTGRKSVLPDWATPLFGQAEQKPSGGNPVSVSSETSFSGQNSDASQTMPSVSIHSSSATSSVSHVNKPTSLPNQLVAAVLSGVGKSRECRERNRNPVTYGKQGNALLNDNGKRNHVSVLKCNLKSDVKVPCDESTNSSSDSLNSEVEAILKKVDSAVSGSSKSELYLVDEKTVDSPSDIMLEEISSIRINSTESEKHVTSNITSLASYASPGPDHATCSNSKINPPSVSSVPQIICITPQSFTSRNTIVAKPVVFKFPPVIARKLNMHDSKI